VNSGTAEWKLLPLPPTQQHRRMFPTLSFKKFQRRIRLPFTFFKKLTKKQKKNQSHKRQASKQNNTHIKSGAEDKSVHDVSPYLAVRHLFIDLIYRPLPFRHSMSKSHPLRTPSLHLTLASSSRPHPKPRLPNLVLLRACMRLSVHYQRL
jgi:hypothetical protein